MKQTNQLLAILYSLGRPLNLYAWLTQWRHVVILAVNLLFFPNALIVQSDI